MYFNVLQYCTAGLTQTLTTGGSQRESFGARARQNVVQSARLCL